MVDNHLEDIMSYGDFMMLLKLITPAVLCSGFLVSVVLILLADLYKIFQTHSNYENNGI